MEKSRFLKEEMTDLYYQTENVLQNWNRLPKTVQKDLIRIKDHLVKKQTILGEIIKLMSSTS